MSSTNRKVRHQSPDVYYTPPYCVHRLLDVLPLPGGVWLEAGAGHGAIIQAVNAVRQDVVWAAYELRAECQPTLDKLATVVRMGDCLEFTPKQHSQALRQVSYKPRYDVTIFNPPFRLAFQFLHMALAISDYVVMLQRLNYLGSRQRSEFFQVCPPDVFVLPDRPSFEGGQSDSVEYCWMVWHPGERTRPSGSLRILAKTPIEERGGKRRTRIDETEAQPPVGQNNAALEEDSTTLSNKEGTDGFDCSAGEDTSNFSTATEVGAEARTNLHREVQRDEVQ